MSKEYNQDSQSNGKWQMIEKELEMSGLKRTDCLILLSLQFYRKDLFCAERLIFCYI